MGRIGRYIVAATLLTIGTYGVADGTVSAAPKKQTIVVRVVDQDGGARAGATALACPVVGGQQDCAQAVSMQTNAAGYARLQVDTTVTYGLFSFVSNPQPPWACAGFVIGDQELYLSERIEAIGSQLPRSVTFTITEPSPLDCAAVTVTDDSGNALPTAGLFVCAHVSGSTDCIGDRFEGPDADGVIRIKVDPDLVYDLGTFIANSGWPCPGYEAPDGTLFHFGGSGSFTAADFLAGITLVIPVPRLSDCTPGTVTVTDDSGNLLTTAGLFVCAHVPGSTDCIGDRFDGADADGIIRLDVDPDLVYDLGTFIANTGWPCPGFILDDGTPLWFGGSGTFTADNLLAGVTLVIPVPDAADCTQVPTGQVTVTDDSGQLLATAGLFVCAHAPGSQDCIGDRFENTDPDGIIRIDVDQSLVYDLGTYIANPGWACPSYYLDDGTVLFFGENGTFTADQLLSGVVMVIPKPEADDCVQVTVVDDSGNPLPNADIGICAHVPDSSECVGKPNVPADQHGVAWVPFDPTLIYDLTPSARNTGWPCPSFTASDGTTFHSGPQQSFSADELSGGVTLVLPVPKAENCVAVTVTDDSGNPLPTAILSVCPHDPGSACVNNYYDGPDSDGVIRVLIEPGSVYDIGAFATNTGWPCPGFIGSDGTTFHFGPDVTYTTTELQAGVTVVIPVPSPDSCST